MNPDFPLQRLPDQTGINSALPGGMTGDELIDSKGHRAGNILPGRGLPGVAGRSRLAALVPDLFQGFLKIEQGILGKRRRGEIKFQDKPVTNPRDQPFDRHELLVVEGAGQMSYFKVLANPCKAKLLDIHKAIRFFVQNPAEIMSFKLSTESNLAGIQREMELEISGNLALEQVF